VLLVEQHADLALGMADRGYVLSHGEVLVRGDSATLRDDPQLLLSSYLGEEVVERSASALAADLEVTK
jgi:branched-chain amino acid transport system ATP-binding protein